MFLNFALFISGLAILGLGITIYAREKQADAYDWGFMITGLVLSGMSFFGCQLKKSPGCLALYLIIIVSVATAMLALSIAYFVGVPQLVDIAAQEYADKTGKTIE